MRWRNVTFLPVAVREFRAASRKSQTYWGRMVAPMIGLVMCFVSLWTVIYSGASLRDGRQLFTLLGFLFYALTVMSAMASADLITSEKRDGTLGLLFLTPLKGFDVGIGKLVPAFTMSFYGLLACLPILTIPLLLGGVALKEFVRLAIALLMISVWSLALGLLVSTICKDVNKAVASLGLTMPLWGFSMPDLLLHTPAYKKFPEICDVLVVFMPRQLVNLAASVTPQGLDMFWVSFIAHLAMTVALVAVSCALLPTSWKEGAIGRPDAGWRLLYHNWKFGDAAFRNAFRRRIFGINPIFWLRARQRVIGAGMVILALGGFALAAANWQWGVPPAKAEMKALLTFGIGWAIVTPIFAIILLGSISSIGQLIGEDRRTGALELIAGTQLTVREVLRGHWLAVFRRGLPFLLALLLSAFLAINWFFEMSRTAENAHGTFWEHLARGFATLGTTIQPDPPQVFALFVVLAGTLLPLAATAMGWAALWSGMRVRKTNNASPQAFFLVLGLPFPILMLINLTLVYGRRYWGWVISENPYFWMLLAFSVAALNAITIIVLTRRALLKNFRIWAADRFEPEKTEFFLITKAKALLERLRPAQVRPAA